jgi:hypothetical protein
LDERCVFKPIDPFLQAVQRMCSKSPPRVLVTHIEAKSGAPYTACGPITVGSRPWYDREYTMCGDVSGELNGGVLIQTAMEDKARTEWDFCSFVVNQPCYVYLLVVRNFNSQASEPTTGGEWLPKSFDLLSAKMSLDWHHHADLAVWRSKQVIPRGKVIIGGPSSQYNYSIVIKSCYSSMTFPSPQPRRIRLYSDFFQQLPDSILYSQQAFGTTSHSEYQSSEAQCCMLSVADFNADTTTSLKRKREEEISIDAFLSVDTSLDDPQDAPALLSPDLSDESDDSSKAKRKKVQQWYESVGPNQINIPPLENMMDPDMSSQFTMSKPLNNHFMIKPGALTNNSIYTIKPDALTNSHFTMGTVGVLS